MKSKKIKNIVKLFFVFLKIGAFTFGGGYAMIPLIENECVTKEKWISEEDMTTMVTVAESTPGPLAINSATFVGYKIAGFWGSFFATLGVIIPSFLIIFLISLYFDKFLSFTVVTHAFKGIKCAVAVLIVTTGIKMLKNGRKNFISVFLTVLSFSLATVFDIFSINFSTIWLIIFGGGLFLLLYSVKRKREVKK